MKLSVISQLLLLFLTVETTCGQEQEKAASGLLFSSKTVSISQRTSLELFNGNPHKFSERFALSFDLSLRDSRRFGYIMRLIDPREGGNEASLVFVNFRPDKQYYIDFNTVRTGQNIQMRIPSDKIGIGKWIHVRMDFDLAEDRVVISLADTSYECGEVGFDDPARLQLNFGLHGINLDVPAMALKNIRIEERGRLRHVIPLNESSGEVVHDTLGHEIGTVKNPGWLITEHFNWSSAASFDVPLKSGVAYNPSSAEIYVVSRDSLRTFRTATRTVVANPIETITMPIDEAIFNPRTNQTWLYNLNAPVPEQASITWLNMGTLALDSIGCPQLKNKLHHHNAFFNSAHDTLFLFGGYGNFSYSNKLYRYDRISDSWCEVRLGSKLKIYPRFFAATGPGHDDSEILMFGGFGNKSGRQELGGKNLYDLTAIDLKNRKARKLWEIAPDSLYVPATNLILSKDRKSFYALIYPHHVATSQLQLCRFDIETGRSEIVSSPIPILSEEIATKAFLFYDASSNGLIAVVREYKDPDTANIRIYTLGSPPVSIRELMNYAAPKKTGTLPTIGIVAILLGSAFAVLWIYRRRQAATRLSIKPLDTSGTQSVQIRRNAVYLLGDFLVFNASGRDITYRFSTKLRMLFDLVLFHSTEQHNGVSTEMLSATLWPEKEIAKTKNIRGVTINHLRKILDDIAGIELICENSRWRFSFGDDFYCDYIHAISLCRDTVQEAGIENDAPDSTDLLMRIVTRGTLLPLITESWVETYRIEFEKIIEQKFQTEIAILRRKGDYSRALSLIEASFFIDPINEDMLSAGISTLREIGRSDRALIFYNDFCTRFRTVVGVDYPHTFDTLTGNKNHSIGQ